MPYCDDDYCTWSERYGCTMSSRAKVDIERLVAENTKLLAVAAASLDALDCLDLACRQGIEADALLRKALAEAGYRTE